MACCPASVTTSPPALRFALLAISGMMRAHWYFDEQRGGVEGVASTALGLVEGLARLVFGQRVPRKLGLEA